ncbi:MAG: hypothetical protein NVSMB27_12050 [Ktedonobacteraceae bacterium]
MRVTCAFEVFDDQYGVPRSISYRYSNISESLRRASWNCGKGGYLNETSNLSLNKAERKTTDLY